MTLLQLEPGQQIRARELVCVKGDSVRVPDPAWLVHLQFRRFAGCPICNLHLRSIARRHAEIQAAGVREVAVYRSSQEALLPYVSELPFNVIAEPTGGLHEDFGVGRSVWAMSNPRAWSAVARGTLAGLAGAPVKGEDPLALPADFLIDSAGRVVDCKYGGHADDQWSVDEILHLAASRRAALGSIATRY